MKNKHIAWSIFLLVALMFAPVFASAVSDLGLEGVAFGNNNPTFGGQNQRASNPMHDNGPVVIKAQKSISFKNNGATQLSMFTTTFTPDGSVNMINADIVITSQPVSGIGPNGGIEQINFEAKIPEDLDAVDTNMNPAAFKVGTLKINATGLNEPLMFDVFMQRENQLEISDADVEINSKQRKNLDDGDDIENIKPGDRLEIDVEVANNYDDSDEVDIEDVDLILRCVPDKDLDIDDETLDLGDLSPEDEDTDSFLINIEEDAEDRDISCELRATGLDENGARMGEKLDFKIEVNRENHDIKIRLPLAINPQAITCDATSLQMTVSFINLGKSDEDEVAVEVTSADLNYQDRRSNIELDEDDSEVEVFDIPLATLPGKSPISFTIRTFYDNVRTSKTETLLVENTCLQKQPEEPDQPGLISPSAKGKLILEEGIVSTTPGKFNSIAVQVTNSETRNVASFEIGLSDISDFATPSTAKVIQLQPGQTSTVFLNFKTKPDVEEGTYTGTVTLRSGGQTVDTQLFTVEVAGAAEKKSAGLGFGNLDTTKVFWIIGDIILIIVAIFFIRLIFTGGRKKKGDKKMADYEAEAARKARR